MRRAKHPIRKTDQGKIAVDQGIINGWFLTYNPDDSRFYICEQNNGADPVATFKHHHNAVRHCRNLEVNNG